MKEIFRTNWQLLFLFIIAGLIPTDTNVFPIVCLWFAAWLYTGEYKKIRLSFWAIAGISFFALQLAGLVYSDNKMFAMEQLANHLYFAAFPLLIGTCNLKPEDKKNILMIFVLACVCVAIFLFSRAVYCAFAKHTTLFTYSRFSFFLHPSYVSMFMVWAIVLLIRCDFNFSNRPELSFLIRNLAVILLVACVLFCASKIGVVSLLLVFLFSSFYRFRKTGFVKHVAFYIIPVLFFSCIFIKEVPAPLKRLKTGIAVLAEVGSGKSSKIFKMQKDEESTLVRLAIWRIAGEMMTDHLLFGTGSGDVRNDLMDSYKQVQLTSAYKSKLNAHNQFIETQLGLGIFGSSLLLILTVGFLGYGIYKNEFLPTFFALLICMNLLVESMFEWRVACEFFAFFLFLFPKKENSAMRSEASLKIQIAGLEPQIPHYR